MLIEAKQDLKKTLHSVGCSLLTLKVLRGIVGTSVTWPEEPQKPLWFNSCRPLKEGAGHHKWTEMFC